ncbi:MAG: hypothetical protein U1E02_36160, partial [Hydrogenophaga sp.]|nr:hypothetical protein [Hydrogenophaga sp.]
HTPPLFPKKLGHPQIHFKNSVHAAFSARVIHLQHGKHSNFLKIDMHKIVASFMAALFLPNYFSIKIIRTYTRNKKLSPAI